MRLRYAASRSKGDLIDWGARLLSGSSAALTVVHTKDLDVLSRSACIFVSPSGVCEYAQCRWVMDENAD
jgi:hypothetical protein